MLEGKVQKPSELCYGSKKWSNPIRPPNRELQIHLRLFLLQQLSARRGAHTSWEHYWRGGECRSQSWWKGWRSHCPALSPAPSESGRKRARRAAHTSLARSIPWMLCVNTHYPSDPSWSLTPSRKPAPAITKHPSAKHSGTNFPHTSGLCSTLQLDLWGALPKVLFLYRFFAWCCLHAWGRSILLPSPLMPSSCGFFTPTALLISL